MGRGAPGLFKRLMPLGDVKAAAVARREPDGMAGGHAGAPVSVRAGATWRRGGGGLKVASAQGSAVGLFLPFCSYFCA